MAIEKWISRVVLSLRCSSIALIKNQMTSLEQIILAYQEDARTPKEEKAYEK